MLLFKNIWELLISEKKHQDEWIDILRKEIIELKAKLLVLLNHTSMNGVGKFWDCFPYSVSMS